MMSTKLVFELVCNLSVLVFVESLEHEAGFPVAFIVAQL